MIDWILKDPARGHKAETHLKNKLKTPQVVPTSTDLLGKSKNKKEAKRENRSEAHIVGEGTCGSWNDKKMG